jgi:hypothetical protein
VGDGEPARVCKIGTTMLGVVIENLAEITLPEQDGVPRHAFLAFSTTAVMVNVHCLQVAGAGQSRLDHQCSRPSSRARTSISALEMAREMDVPMPVSGRARCCRRTSVAQLQAIRRIPAEGFLGADGDVMPRRRHEAREREQERRPVGKLGTTWRSGREPADKNMRNE